MTICVEPHIITQDGKPAFAVIPWKEYQRLIGNQMESNEPDITRLPNEVAKANNRGDCLIKAWREYFQLTQAELAAKAGMKQSALARLEKSNSRPRKPTLTKLAETMGIEIEQLMD